MEDDWNAGRFKNFYSPHPEHVEESHTSTVYMVRFSGQNLISGGRDRSIRIWNLETQRTFLSDGQDLDKAPLRLLYASTPVRLYAFTPLRLYASTPLRLYASTPLRLYTSTPLCLYAFISPRLLHLCVCVYVSTPLYLTPYKTCKETHKKTQGDTVRNTGRDTNE
ncbi:hypothetical protein V2W45_1332910 [Cenococcum geophilum]